MNGAAEPTSRGIVVIVLSGALLGLGFNYLGQQSRPARGLAWITEPKQLQSLEDAFAHSIPKADDPPAQGVATPIASVTAPAPPQAANTKQPPEPKTAPSTTGAATHDPASSVADPDDPLGIAVPSDSAEGLPEIPDLDRPFAVQIALVKRFFDAKAAFIVDARDVEEFEEGHIPGAVNLPFSTAGSDPARLEAIDAGERPIIVYCGGGTCEVSMTLAETLVYQFAKRKVLVYMGGFPEWKSAGYPVQTGKGDEVKG